MNLLSPINTILDTNKTLPESIYHEWLWGTNPEESYDKTVLLNRNHLLGLLICRHKFLCNRDSMERHNMNRLTIMDKSISSMTWRELKDTLSNLLFEWPAFLERLHKNIRGHQNLRQVLSLVNQCAARFGELSRLATTDTILDDPSETQPCKVREHADKVVLTPAAMRRCLGSILIMFRHLFLLDKSSKIPAQGYQACISKYNYEASMDNFHILCMHISIPVGGRLTYRHDFPGMYNHISQVVYFHNSQYTRTARHPLGDIKDAPAVHILPAIQELYPEIPLRFEEDHFDPTKSQGWYWLLIAGRIYLVTPQPSIWYSDNISDLLKKYIDTTNT